MHETRKKIEAFLGKPIQVYDGDPMDIPCIETSDAEQLCKKPLVSVHMTTYNHEPYRKLLNYTIGMLLRDIFPSAFLCVLMGGVIYPLNWLSLPEWGLLLLQICVGMLSYFLLAWIFKVTPLRYMMQMVTPMFFDHVPMTFKSLISKLFMRLK